MLAWNVVHDDYHAKQILQICCELPRNETIERRDSHIFVHIQGHDIP